MFELHAWHLSKSSKYKPSDSNTKKHGVTKTEALPQAWSMIGGPRMRFLTFALIYAMAIWLRVGDPYAPGSLIEREFRSGIIARSLYYSMKEPSEKWRREVAETSWRREGRLEPPVTEFLAAVVYRLTAEERLWIGHVIPSFFWLIGGYYIFSIARRVVSPNLALVSVGFYLLAPLAVTTSRSFMPDSLMILLFLASIHAMLRYAEQPSRLWFAWVIVTSAGAVLVKPFVVFMVLMSFLFMTLRRKGTRGAVITEMFVFVVLVLAPTAAWYGYGSIAGTDWDIGIRVMSGRKRPNSMITEQFLRSVVPQKIMRLQFWEEWVLLAMSEVGYVALPAGLIGWVAMAPGITRSLLAGCWVAYPFFGLATSGRITDHGYYHLQLIPVVAVSLAPITAIAWTKLRSNWWRTSNVIAVALTLVWVGFSVQTVRQRLAAFRFESPDVCRAVGEAVGHTTRAVYVSRHYGRPLEYYGELAGVPWPSSREISTTPVTVEERLDLLTFEPEYFIVTDFDFFGRYHKDLNTWLETHCAVTADEKFFRIWQRCSRDKLQTGK